MRFPLAVAFAVVSIAAIIADTLASSNQESLIREHIAECSQIGFFLSAAAVVWSESLRRSKVYFQCGAFVVTALLFAAWQMAKTDEFMYVCAAALALLFFLPCLKGHSLKVSHSYTTAVLRGAIFAALVSLCMLVLLFIVWITIDDLFNVRRSYDANLVAMQLLCIFLPNILFLSRMPSVDDDSNVPGISAKLAKNLLLLPALGYMAILYAYEIMIVAEWELPKKPITWMVTGIVAVVLFIVFGMQGYLADDNAKPSSVNLARLARRWLPVMLLPLLALMSVSIAYRIGQYGLTPSRLYAVAFNLWAYGAALYLIFNRNAQFTKLAAAFAGIFLAVSVVPGFNFSSVSLPKDEAGEVDCGVVEEVVEVEPEGANEEKVRLKKQSKPLLIADLSKSYAGIERVERDYIYRVGKGPVVDIMFIHGTRIDLPIDSLMSLPDSTFVPFLLPVKGDDRRAFAPTCLSVAVRRDSVNGEIYGYSGLSIEGILLSKDK